MRLSANWNRFLSVLALAGFTLAVCGCAPEASTPVKAPSPAVSTGKPAGAVDEQAGSDKGAGAEVPSPADPEPDAAGDQ